MMFRFATILFVLCLIDCFNFPFVCTKNIPKHSNFLLTLQCRFVHCRSGNVSEPCISCTARRSSNQSVKQPSNFSILSSLLFNTMYILKIEPINCSRKKLQLKLVAPMSSNTQHSSNISAHWSTNSDLIINFSSFDTSTNKENEVTLMELDGHHPSTYVSINSSKVVLSGLNSSMGYLVTVQDMFPEKASTRIKLPPQSQDNRQQFRSSSPYYYIVPGGIVLFLVLVSVLVKHRAKLLTRSASRTLDVDGALKPFVVLPEKIQMLEEIGRGAFAVVHKGLYLRNKSKTTVAIKVFEAHANSLLLHEASMLRLVGRHDHILQLMGVCLDTGHLLTEYCAGGSLLSHLGLIRSQLMRLKSHPRTDDEKRHGMQLCTYIHQICQALSYISSLKLVHRDVAARNVLLKSDLRTVVLGDFGLARDIYEKGNYSGRTLRPLPIRWMAPEAIQGKKFGSRTDVWSFGVLMWEIFKLGKKPYSALQNEHVLPFLEMGYRLQKPHCTQQWYDLMLQCWHKNSRQRPRFNELVQKTTALLEAMSNYVPLA